MSIRLIATMMKSLSVLEEQPKTKEVALLAIFQVKPNTKKMAMKIRKLNCVNRYL